MNPILLSPHIDGETTEKQLHQMKSYLYQFKEQIEMILSNIDAENFSKSTNEMLEKVSEYEKKSLITSGSYSSQIKQLANEISLEVTRASSAEGEIRSSLSVLDGEVSAKVEKGVSYNGAKITTSGISCKGNGSLILDMANITLDSSGNLKIKGEVQASSGFIGDMLITNGRLYWVDTDGAQNWIGKDDVSLTKFVPAKCDSVDGDVNISYSDSFTFHNQPIGFVTINGYQVLASISVG